MSSIAERRKEARDKIAQRTVVKILLPVSRNGTHAVILASCILAIVILVVVSYFAHVATLIYDISQDNMAEDGEVSFLIQTVLIVVIFTTIKYFEMDRYVQNIILDVLFVLRCDAILSGSIPETYVDDADNTKEKKSSN